MVPHQGHRHLVKARIKRPTPELARMEWPRTELATLGFRLGTPVR